MRLASETLRVRASRAHPDLGALSPNPRHWTPCASSTRIEERTAGPVCVERPIDAEPWTADRVPRMAGSFISMLLAQSAKCKGSRDSVTGSRVEPRRSPEFRKEPITAHLHENTRKRNGIGCKTICILGAPSLLLPGNRVCFPPICSSRVCCAHRFTFRRSQKRNREADPESSLILLIRHSHFFLLFNRMICRAALC